MSKRVRWLSDAELDRIACMNPSGSLLGALVAEVKASRAMRGRMRAVLRKTRETLDELLAEQPAKLPRARGTAMTCYRCGELLPEHGKRMCGSEKTWCSAGNETGPRSQWTVVAEPDVERAEHPKAVAEPKTTSHQIGKPSSFLDMSER